MFWQKLTFVSDIWMWLMFFDSRNWQLFPWWHRSDPRVDGKLHQYVRSEIIPPWLILCLCSYFFDRIIWFLNCTLQKISIESRNLLFCYVSRYIRIICFLNGVHCRKLQKADFCFRFKLYFEVKSCVPNCIVKKIVDNYRYVWGYNYFYVHYYYCCCYY